MIVFLISMVFSIYGACIEEDHSAISQVYFSVHPCDPQDDSEITTDYSTITIDGQVYFPVTNPYRRKEGFGYSRYQEVGAFPSVDGAIFKGILSGKRVDLMTEQVRGVTFLSVGNERVCGNSLLWEFCEKYDHHDSFVCVDFADRLCVAHIQDWKAVHLGHPPGYPARHAGGRFHECFNRYLAEEASPPLVFLSNGYDGLTKAARFLYQLRFHEAWSKKPRVTFLFVALQADDVDTGDIEDKIASAASQMDAGYHNWWSIFSRCVDRVICKKVFPHKVIFSQDAENIMHDERPPPVPIVLEELAGITQCDVLMSNLGPESSREGSHLFFEALSIAVGAGSITEQEEKADLCDRSQHVLIYAESLLPQIGHVVERIVKKLGYKGCKAIHMRRRGVSIPTLIVEGCTYEGHPKGFEELWVSKSVTC